MPVDPRDRAEQRTLLLPQHEEQGGGLAPGTRLQEFVVERQLGAGGWSIVYLARDTRLGRRVALKEYVPATLAMRAPDGEVVPRLPRFRELYERGLQSFLDEARLLGSFDHPAMVKVYHFWAGNGTAYMVMPHYEGITLQKWLSDLGTPPSERWLRDLAESLIAALAVMHAQSCYHRDVAPDNILMLYDRSAAGKAGSYLAQRPRPVLLDFSAARRVISGATQNLTSMLKSGYSPVEQYEGEVSQRQGPWTDVYALCAVLYSAAIGKVPASSIARAVRDEMVPAREAGRGQFSVAFLAAIDAGLRVRPEDRPQAMAELKQLFDAPATAPAPSKSAAVAAAAAKPQDAAGAAPAAASGAGAAAAAPATPPSAPRPRWLLPAVAGAALLVALAAAAWLRRG